MGELPGALASLLKNPLTQTLYDKNKMPELIRKIQDKILSDREIWNAGKSNEVSIALEKKKCTFHVTNSQGNDITTLVASNLSALNIKHNLYQTIDSWMFEVSQTEKEHILKLIDNEW